MAKEEMAPPREEMGEISFEPRDGGKIEVTLKVGRKSLWAPVMRADIAAQAVKLGLGEPTPKTPVPTDRHTG